MLNIFSDLSTSFTFWLPLPRRKDLHRLVPIGQEGTCIPKPSRRCWWKENFPAPLRNLSPNHPVCDQSHYWAIYILYYSSRIQILQCWNHPCHTWVSFSHLFPSLQLLTVNFYNWHISVLTHLAKKANNDEMMMMMMIIIITINNSEHANIFQWKWQYMSIAISMNSRRQSVSYGCWVQVHCYQ
jgi:hypothetical protein